LSNKNGKGIAAQERNCVMQPDTFWASFLKFRIVCRFKHIHIVKSENEELNKERRMPTLVSLDLDCSMSNFGAKVKQENVLTCEREQNAADFEVVVFF
jgi:hypothetical protein